jgi:hypothetical protein
MFSAMEYMLMAIFPITESARMTATNLPNPPAGDSIAVTTPPAELARLAASHSGTLGTAPPMAAPRMRRGMVGITIPV